MTSSRARRKKPESPRRASAWLLFASLAFGLPFSSPAQDSTRTSVGFKPLIELRTGLYKGFQGGLYPGGQNERPAVHEASGRAIAQQIVPLSPTGTIDPVNGRIVLLSIGMSNTTQEFSTFKPLADKDPSRHPRLIIVDGAQGGQTAALISNSSAPFWTVIDQRLASAGVTRQQVQVVWIKEADAGPTQPFPVHAATLQTELETVARIVKMNYPNIRLAYLSSRIYGGYATTNLNPEPYAYESGFSIKWLIEKQINGDATLAYSGETAKAPWLSWGPYLWADGLTPRADGLTWHWTDFVTDGTHPSTSGRTKVANLLLNFFKSDPTTTPWFRKPSATTIQTEAGETSRRFSLEQNYPNPFNGTTSFELRIRDFSGGESVTIRIFDVLGRTVATLIDQELFAGTYHISFSADDLPSGVYFCRLVAGPYSQTRSMVLSK